MKYTVEIPQLHSLQRAFREAPEVVAKEVIKAGNRSLIRYQGTAREKAPIDRGQLRGSIQVTPMARRLNAIEGRVGTNVKHAIWQEEGTGIYGPEKRPIRPKSGKVMVFNVGGRKVFARSVKGVRGKRYMQQSVERNQEATIRDFGKALDNVTSQLGGSL